MTEETQTSPVRNLEGIELPAPGRWEIDPDHSNVEFVVRHAFTKMRGRFNSFSGHVTVGTDPLESKVQVSIDPSSVDTGQEYRDNHLRSDDFFDTETHPEWTFISTSVRDFGDHGLVVEGALTIRGITKQVNLHVDYLGVMASTPGGNARASFSATTKINRNDFNVSWNDFLESGMPFNGRTITIDLQVELIYQAEED